MVYSSCRMWTNVLNSTSIVPNSPASASYQTNPPPTFTPDGFREVSVDREIEQLSRASDAVSSSLHFHPMTQNQDQQGQQYNLNHTLHQVVGLPAPHFISTGAPAGQQRGIDACRATLQPVSEVQDPYQLLNQRIRQTTTQSPNIPQFSSVPPMQVQHASQNAIGAAAGSSKNNRSLRAAQLAAQVVRLHGGATAGHPQTPRTAPSNLGHVSVMSLARSDGLQELPSEQNWRPTGPMRGSLTGSACSAALSQYLVPSTGSARPTTCYDSSSLYG